LIAWRAVAGPEGGELLDRAARADDQRRLLSHDNGAMSEVKRAMTEVTTHVDQTAFTARGNECR
jgi:hypothetical protein